MTGNTVTPQQVSDNMKDVIVRTLDDFGKPTTYVTVKMQNGFTLRESTTCVDPANYDEEVGKSICLKKIEDKVWFLLGYALQDKLHNEPKNYVERLQHEIAELNERIARLETFMSDSCYKELPHKKQILLEHQYDVMHEYHDCLTARLELETASPE